MMKILVCIEGSLYVRKLSVVQVDIRCLTNLLVKDILGIYMCIYIYEKNLYKNYNGVDFNLPSNKLN